MAAPSVRGLFFTGTSTEVGKTYVAALVAAELVAAGYRVGVYKPVASGCEQRDGELISGDATRLWQAAGQPGEFAAVCPQCFAAPLAPHLAARCEGRRVDPELLRRGLAYWIERSEIVLVEGAGGLMSPISDEDFVADLAADLGFPLVVVAANELGVINQTLQTLITAAAFRDGLPVAGIVLNETHPPDAADISRSSNRDELIRHCIPPLLASVAWQSDRFDRSVPWFALAAPPRIDLSHSGD
jgi:dethiobiotin synthetase